MIRPARREEAEQLTQISFASKAHWGYPAAFFEIWRSELTLLPEYMDANEVFVLEEKGRVVGYYSLVQLEDEVELGGISLPRGFWLEHMFVLPEFIGHGMGSALFRHLRQRCRTRGVNKVGILADPNAKGFYLKMGADYVKEFPSTIAGRTTPFLVLKIKSS